MSSKINFSPNFIGIGVEKAGTTWISINLEAHPEICMSAIKEINFFNESYRYRKGINFYRSFFENCPKNKIIGEFTTAYIYSNKAPFLIKKHFPDVKLIASLRNPIDRAYSSFKFQRQIKGPLSIYRTFEELITKNPLFLERGYYYRQLKQFYELFPKENILIVLFEDIKKNPINFIQNIYKFLGVKNKTYIPPIIYEKRNVTNTSMAKYKIPFINNLIYKYIELTGGRIRRMDPYNWLEGLADYFKLKEVLEKFLLYNRKRVFVKNESLSFTPPIKNETRKLLWKIYKKDIKNLESLLNLKLDLWD